MNRVFTIALVALVLSVFTPASADARSFPKRFRILKGHANFITQLSFDAKGSLLASVAQDATVRIWSVKRGRSLAKLTAPDTDDFGVIALAPSGKLLAVTVGTVIRIYGVGGKKKKKVTQLKELKGHKGEIKPDVPQHPWSPQVNA